MGRFCAILVLSLIFSSCRLPGTSPELEVEDVGSFRQLSSLSEPRVGHVMEAVDGKLYIIGGAVSGPVFRSSVEEYDIASNSWQIKAPMSRGRQGMGSATVGGKIYVFGGIEAISSTGVSTVEEFDPAINTWTQKNDMPVTAKKVIAAAVETSIYVFPVDLSGVCVGAQGFRYYPESDTWTSVSEGPEVGLCGSHRAVYGSDIYFLGRNPIVVYRSATDTWDSFEGSIENYTSNGGQSAVAINEKLFVFEELSSYGSGSAYSFTNSGFSISDFHWGVTLTLSSAVSVGDVVYLSGGANPSYEASSALYEFTPAP